MNADDFDAIWGHALASGFDPSLVDREHRLVWSDWFEECGRADVAEAVRVMAAYEVVPLYDPHPDKIFSWWSPPWISIGDEPRSNPRFRDTDLPFWWFDLLSGEPMSTSSMMYDSAPAAFRELVRAYCIALEAGVVPDVVREKASVLASGV